MVRKFFLFIFISFSFVSQTVNAEVFEYKHHAGDRYRILSVVKEDVYINRVLSHRAEILNRIAVEVTEEKAGAGVHNAVFQTSERIMYDSAGCELQAGVTGFQWAREYESVFERDKLGYLNIDPKYFMPVVRDVPVFSGRDLKVLERWSAEGYEIHDFRDSFGIEEPYRIPFTANYQFIGEQSWKGNYYPAFSVNYRIDSRPQAVSGWIWPRRITGLFNQKVFWGREQGQPVAYEETFRITFEMSDGRSIEYRGTAQAEFVESEFMDREQLVSALTEEIEQLDIADVNVRKVEEGVSISLEDIGFYSDSARLLPGEYEKLDKIIEILKRFPNRDIVVSGHTALAGTSEGRMTLSVERARAVTDYLLTKEARTADRIVIRGFGSDKPIADNSTEEGMRRNRRVEITILEN